MFLLSSPYKRILSFVNSQKIVITLLLVINCSSFTWSLAGNLTSSIGFNRTLDFNRKQAVLTKSGFTQILYEYIDSNVKQLYLHQVTPQCIDSLINLNRSIENGDPWAFKMLDASGRAPIDLTGIGYVDMGNFDTCLQLEWDNGSGDKEVGQHCLTSVLPNPPNPGTVADLFTSRKLLVDYDEGFSMRIGFCIPSSCSTNDLQIVLNRALEPFFWSVLRVDSCQIAKSFSEKFWSAPSFQQISFIFLATFVSLVVYATWFDCFTRIHQHNDLKKSKVNGNQGWKSKFSILTHWKNLTQPDMEIERCMILAQCALMQHVVVLVFHAIIWPIISNAMTLYAIGNPIVKYRESQFVRNLFGEWFMDGLFAYAGVTRALELWKKITPETPFWRVCTIIFRKMLILDVLFCILIMIETVTPLLSYGPFNPLIAERRAEICSQTYIANLLFYQNYVGSLDKVCIAHSWSLAAEYQLVFFLAGLIWLYKRIPKLTLTLNIFVITGGLIHIGRVFSSHNLWPHPLARGFHPSIVAKWTESVYLPSEMHLWLYLAAPLWVYILMNPSFFKFTQFIEKHREVFSKGLYLYGLGMILYPYIWSSISAYESPLLISIYIVIYRCFTGVFYTILTLIHGEEMRYHFSMKSESSPQINNNNNNCGSTRANEIVEVCDCTSTITKNASDNPVDQLSSVVNNQSKKYSPSASAARIKFIHVATIIFRSSYCIHIPVLIWYYSQHRWPVLTMGEWGFHFFSTIFLSLTSGLIFYLFILGPVNNLTESIKPKNNQDNKPRLKDD